MQLMRILRHLLAPAWWTRRIFPAAALRVIAQAIAASEAKHRGELRLVIEGGLPLSCLWRGQPPRARALALFAQLGVWDTAENSGVLIYLQLIDRRVEIVADRGIDALLGEVFWRAVCQRMEAAFRAGDFQGGVLQALQEITGALRTHFPASDDKRNDKRNELPDQPLVLF